VLLPSRGSWRAGYRRKVVLGDIAAATLGAATGAVWTHFSSNANGSVTQLLLATALPLVWLICVAILRGYEPRILGTGDEEFRRVARAGIYLVAACAVVDAFGIATLDHDRFIAVILITTALGLTSRCILRASLRRARSEGRCLQRALIVCHEGHLLHLAQKADEMSRDGLTIVGACLPSVTKRPLIGDDRVEIVGDFSDIVGSARGVSADVVAVAACPELDATMLRQLRWGLAAEDIDLVLLATVAPVNGRMHTQPVSGVRVLQVAEPELRGLRHLVKAAFDRGLAAISLLILWPFMLVTALAIRFTSAGPGLYRQTRIGRDGHPFTMLKFRTMVQGADKNLDLVAHLNHHQDGVLFKIPDDPRVTPIGRWLRRHSLDELPQLINILLGQMSFVGPRPPLPAEVEQYAEEESLRLRVRPGLTGLWQVSGRSDLSWAESVQLDLSYVENWSLWRDFSILFRTVGTVLHGTGAY